MKEYTMRQSHWIISLLLSTTLCAGSAIAAEANNTQPAPKAPALEQINSTPAGEHKQKDCPVLEGKNDCQHKKGEPCDYKNESKKHKKMHDQCDYMKQG